MIIIIIIVSLSPSLSLVLSIVPTSCLFNPKSQINAVCMNFAYTYRVLLRKLKKACTQKPHFVVDLRVLLSYDIPSRNLSFPCEYPPHICGREALLIDTNSLFELSKMNLRHSIERSLSDLPGKRLPLIASHILYKKELMWINQRLDGVLSDSTEKALRMLQRIGEGPTEGDFIPDDFFDGHSTNVGVSKNEAFDSNAIYSAGALGSQRELVVLSRREREFPLLHCFLGSSVLDHTFVNERYTESGCISSLIQAVSSKLSSKWGAVGMHAAVRVEAMLFDEDYQNTSESGGGQFRKAHRQFYVSLRVKPLMSKVLRIINVHFFRLEMQTKEMVEDVGYVDDAHVLRMIREHIKAKSAGDDKSMNTDPDDDNDEASTSHEFKVAFKSLSDGPTIVKGILYFKHADSQEALERCDVEAMPFGPVVFHC